MTHFDCVKFNNHYMLLFTMELGKNQLKCSRYTADGSWEYQWVHINPTNNRQAKLTMIAIDKTPEHNEFFTDAFIQ